MSQAQAPVGTGRVEWNEIVATAYRIALTISAGTVIVAALHEWAVQQTVGVPTLFGAVVTSAGALTFGYWQTWARPLATAAGAASALVWLSVLPAVSDEAILVPAFMAAACFGGAVWMTGWSYPARRTGVPPPPQPAEGWIEEDGRRVDDG